MRQCRTRSGEQLQLLDHHGKGHGAACAGPIAFYEKSSDSDLIGSYVAARDVVACAASVVPAYVPCVPTVDAVIAHLRNGSDESAAEDEMWACLDDVSG